MSKKPRAWQRMLSGRRLDLLDPAPVDIEISDIAHGLSFVARWNGQTVGEFPYSVAEHSLLVERILRLLNPRATAEQRLSALLHDAAEYVIGDLISPVKNALEGGYDEMEDRILAAIRLRFGMPMDLSGRQKSAIKRADRMSAWLEARQIAGFDTREADALFLRPPDRIVDHISIILRPPEQVRTEFEKLAADLLNEIDQKRKRAASRSGSN
ncbi:MAG: hypothetical protein J4F49_07955 [Rhodobacteraceae bacterium]|nr:hypothetical protein [Paracoccaceae bacterium]